jgi:hypothetical protein
MPIAGGCLCRQLRYEIAASAPRTVRLCWCRICQYLAAGNATVNAVFDKDAVTITGRRTEYISYADSGARMHRSFCPDCGTQVFSEAEPRPGTIVVRAGTFVIWTASAPSWACFDPELPKVAGQPTLR